jgi:hypothetical protein
MEPTRLQAATAARWETQKTMRQLNSQFEGGFARRANLVSLINVAASACRDPNGCFSLVNQYSEPTLYRLGYIARQLIEAQFGLRCVFMHHVDQLLKQHEVAWVRSYTCPDKDAIEPLLLELVLNNCLSSFAKVG